MAKIKQIHTENAPKAIGPYSQAVSAGGFIFLSGQLAVNPSTGELVNDDIKAQTEQVLSNIQEILIAAGIDLNHVVKTEVFLRDLNDFKLMNEVYEKWFSSEIKPARTTIQAAKLPRDVRIEISCIASLEK